MTDNGLSMDIDSSLDRPDPVSEKVWTLPHVRLRVFELLDTADRQRLALLSRLTFDTYVAVAFKTTRLSVYYRMIGHRSLSVCCRCAR